MNFRPNHACSRKKECKKEKNASKKRIFLLLSVPRKKFSTGQLFFASVGIRRFWIFFSKVVWGKGELCLNGSKVFVQSFVKAFDGRAVSFPQFLDPTLSLSHFSPLRKNPLLFDLENKGKKRRRIVFRRRLWRGKEEEKKEEEIGSSLRGIHFGSSSSPFFSFCWPQDSVSRFPKNEKRKKIARPP